MGFTLNLTNDDIKKAQGGTFEPLPKGVYGAVIFENVQKDSKAGNPMFALNLKITDGPTGIGRKIRTHVSLTPKALFKLVELNKAVGFPYPDKNTAAGAFELEDADEYLGKQVNVLIDTREYVSNEDDAQGNPIVKTDNEVKRLFPYDPDQITKDTDEDEGSAEGGFFLS